VWDDENIAFEGGVRYFKWYSRYEVGYGRHNCRAAEQSADEKHPEFGETLFVDIYRETTASEALRGTCRDYAGSPLVA